MQSPGQSAPTRRRGFAVVDVETTGLDPRQHRIIEVAVALVSAEGQVEHRWSSLIRPGGSTGPVHIHGITQGQLVRAPRFADVVAELSELLNGRILVAHNAQFDWTFLAQEASRAGVRLPVDERLCTVQLARKLCIPSTDFKLGTLARHWNIPVTVAHRAEADVTTLLEIFACCLAEAERQGLPVPLDACTPALSRRERVGRAVRQVIRRRCFSLNRQKQS